MPPTENYRPIPFALRAPVREQIQAMLKDRVLKESYSAYVNPLTLVQHEQKPIRICLDARRINKLMVADRVKVSVQTVTEISWIKLEECYCRRVVTDITTQCPQHHWHWVRWTRYSTRERKLLAIVYALDHFKIYICGHKITLCTDNKTLTFLNKCVVTSDRVACWILNVKQYDIEIKHIKGVQNHLADILSRNCTGLTYSPWSSIGSQCSAIHRPDRPWGVERSCSPARHRSEASCN